MKFYKADWGVSLFIISAVSTVFLIGGPISIILERPRFTWAAILCLAILCGAALFTIRGYTITSDAILVHRLLWRTWLACKPPSFGRMPHVGGSARSAMVACFLFPVGFGTKHWARIERLSRIYGEPLCYGFQHGQRLFRPPRWKSSFASSGLPVILPNEPIHRDYL